MGIKISREKMKKMKVRPYYAVLHAINFLKGRLPDEVEVCLGSDPQACLLYSQKVMKGRLPDHLHNRMMMGTWEGHDKSSVEDYLRYIVPEEEV